MQPQHELGVLANSGRVIAPDLDADVTPEEPERTRDDQQHAALGPADAAAEESPQVLDDLQVPEQVPRRAHPGQAAVFELRSVDDAHDPTDGDRLRCGLELPDEARERVGVEHRVGVDRAEERIDRMVDAGVERVGLAAVDLVDDDDVRLERARVDAVDQLRRDVERGTRPTLTRPRGAPPTQQDHAPARTRPSLSASFSIVPLEVTPFLRRVGRSLTRTRSSLVTALLAAPSLLIGSERALCSSRGAVFRMLFE